GIAEYMAYGFIFSLPGFLLLFFYIARALRKNNRQGGFARLCWLLSALYNLAGFLWFFVPYTLLVIKDIRIFPKVFTFIFGNTEYVNSILAVVVLWMLCASILSLAASKAGSQTEPINADRRRVWENPRKIARVMVIGSTVSTLPVLAVMGILPIAVYESAALDEYVASFYYVLLNLLQGGIFLSPGLILIIFYLSLVNYSEEEHPWFLKKTMWLFSALYNLAGVVIFISTGLMASIFKGSGVITLSYLVVWMITAVIMSFIAYRETW
ncbi:MAG: hypothetical protein AAF708_13335, partial [Deinococcota bacterium]